MLWLGFLLYSTNVAIGLLAQFRHRRFGAWHHILYALVVSSAVAAAITTFRPALLATLAALIAFPFARPRTPWHPALAGVGWVGYAVALASG